MAIDRRIAAALLALAGIVIAGCSKAVSEGSDAAIKSNKQTAANIGYRHIVVDQFGYRPQDAKVAVIRDPKVGYDHADTFTPGERYEVRRSDGHVVYSGSLVAWQDGAVQASSGDRGWWFDFSAVTAPGKYYIYDAGNHARSAAFAIDEHVYRGVLKAAMRTYFYQRSGFAKQPPYVQACWADKAAYLGPNQDGAARDVSDPDNPTKIRDMSGGWFDAGDTNKYVTFAAQPVHQLLTAFQENPDAFTDDFNIPESGNGIPDVIDEIKWETDWLKKMQFDDGSVAAKVGEMEFGKASPPSADTTRRFYVPACTSATIAAAGVYAHAAYMYRQFPALTADANELAARAIKAWNNYHSFPNKQLNCDTGIVHAGDSDLSLADQNAKAAEAAVYLYAITADSAFNEYLKAHYAEMRPYHDFGWSRYVADEGESLLFYTTLANADAALKEKILQDKLADIARGNKVYGFASGDDLYRAYLHDPQYHWGSNQPRANYGNSNLDAVNYKVELKQLGAYQSRALEILHYFHGVNPFGMVYLTNMSAYGATVSANQIFHTWFQPNTKWSDAKTSQCGPAPGYLPGGPNATAAASGVPASVAPPTGQPPQKSYKDWNANWPENSWTVTEPGIYYQASYVKLLSAFAR